MTPLQQNALALILKLNATEFAGWFLPSEVMAFAQIESSFRPHAYRYEPRLREASYGLLQVLASTARGVGVPPPVEAMFDAEVGLRAGMRVARLYWDQLAKHFGREPSYEEWADSYNRGVGGEERIVDPGGEPDDAYTHQWDAAQTHWAPLVDPK